jgi:D-alanine-D-alanine ligase
MRKIRVGIVFGGKSCEHEVSIASARNVVEALDRQKYEPVLIHIDKNGAWHLREALEDFSKQESIALIPKKEGSDLIHLSSPSTSAPPVEVIFPVLHGSFGEDGTIQGLFKMADIPFVGAGVLGSAVGMDKDVMKRLLRDAGIPIGKFVVLYKHHKEKYCYEECVAMVGSPFFIKPANAGSSVGVAKIRSEEEFFQALEEAFLYDRKILVEEFIAGREIECSVLGNEHPIASLPGEIIPQHEFYSYEAKYLDENGAILQVPAILELDVIQRVQSMAVEVFQVLCCEGMARVDFFLKEDGTLLVNEINTIPGFTQISMYPKLWQASGLTYASLLDRLIELALQRSSAERSLQTGYLLK